MSKLCKTFDAQQDITAYELAYMLEHWGLEPFWGGIVFSDEDWRAVPDAIKRHFADFYDAET